MRALPWLLVIAVLCSAGAAVAETPTQAAKRHFIAASHHFDLQEYADALTEFKEAYRLKDDPVFLFNIAQCHRQMGDRDEALRAYKTYLSRSPAAPNRADVEGKITALEQEIAAEQQRKADDAERERKAAELAQQQQHVAIDAAVVATPAPPPKKPLYKKWWLWTAVGAVVVVGVGAGLGVALTRAKSEPTFPNVTF